MTSARVTAVGIGRVGALALALGIGAAVTGGVGVAWADADDTGSSEQTSASDETPSTSAGPARRAARASAPARTTVNDSDQAGPRKTSLQPRAAAVQRPTTNDGPVSKPARVITDDTPPIVSGTETFSSPAVSPAPAATLPQPVAVIPAVVPAAVIPSVPVAVAAPAASVSAPPRAARLLSAARLAPLAGGAIPGGAIDSPAMWAMAAWTRRESTRTTVSAAASRTESTAVPSAAVTVTADLSTAPIGWVTGQNVPLTVGGTRVTQTNNTRQQGIYGTDLGIMWFNGVNGKTQLAFGDTFSGPNMTGDWRNNVLLLSTDTRLYDGLTIEPTGYAGQFIPDARNAVFFIGSEVTNIPTAAVYANDNNYVNYMSVKSWDTPGRWTTNYSAVSMYNTANDKWELQRSTIRSAGWFRSSTRYRAGDQNFQMMSYVLQPESKVVEGQPRYIYAFGTPSGRAGSAFLSRVPEGSITDLKQYEYWDGQGWVPDKPAEAVRVLGDSDKSAGLLGFIRDIANNPRFFGGWFAGLVGAKTGGNVSELSVQYNEYLGKYVAMYGNGQNNIVLRTADTPEGPWSDPITVATSIKYPGLYAPYIHPLSGTGELTDADGEPDLNHIYWNMSLWGPYNVILMKTDVSSLLV